jgi:hypothetical protein
LPAFGAPIVRDGQEVGEIRSGAGDRALALLRLEAVRQEGALTSGETRIQPEVPDWMRLPEPAD